MTTAHPSYTLSEILAADYSMVIPDMQRDYCWGSDDVSPRQPREKVTGFVTGLLHLYQAGRPVPMGLIYGYREDGDPSRIHVIDGQQRLTTLYLLVGMLYRRCRTAALRRVLTADPDTAISPAPRLLYQVRDEAYWFMNDLVANFFLNHDGRLSRIEQSPWYYASYASDPSVCGFISAVRLIDAVLEKADADGTFDFDGFAEYITGQLTFMYHDLGSRRAAESTFITLNTTPQPLSLAQNVKLLAYHEGDDTLARWDALDARCFGLRGLLLPSSDATNTDPADIFLKIYLSLMRYEVPASEREPRPHSLAPLARLGDSAIFGVFDAFSRLADVCPRAVRECAAMTTPECELRLLAAVAYVRRWGDAAADSDIAEMTAWLRNFTVRQRPTASGSDTLTAIRLVAAMPSPSLLSLLDVKGLPQRLVGEEDMCKWSLVRDNSHRADQMWAMIHRAEEHPMLNGRVQQLVKWATPKDASTDTVMLGRYIDAIYRVWGDDIDRRTDLDLLRRALLAMRHPGYPIVRRGDTVLSLCWHAYDWQRLMTNSPGAVRHILDRVISTNGSPEAVLETMVKRFDDRSHPYYFLIKNPDILPSCARRTLMRPCAAFLGMHLNEERYRFAGVSKWWIEQCEMKPMPGWSTVRAYGARCLYTDCLHCDAAIDIYHTPESRDAYRVEFFSRQGADPASRPHVNLAALLSENRVSMRYDRRRDRYYAYCPDARGAISLARNLANLLKIS